MAVTFNHEYLGVSSIGPGETVEIGWELFPGEFPPLIDHSYMVGFATGRHFLEVRTTVVEGRSSGFVRAFYYTIRNLDSHFMYTANDYIFPSRG